MPINDGVAVSIPIAPGRSRPMKRAKRAYGKSLTGMEN